MIFRKQSAPDMHIKSIAGLSLLILLPFHSSASDPLSDKFKPLPAPQSGSLMLQTNDRLAICGDSITEQKMYSRIIEDYLTVCVPDLHVTVRQYGWSGERAPGFLARMTNDCLRFKPTIATTCSANARRENVSMTIRLVVVSRIA